MPLKTRSMILAAIALMTMTPAAGAQDKSGPNINSTVKASPGGAAMLVTAQMLYALGVSNGDALTVLLAARLAGTVDVKQGGTIKKETRGNTPASDEEGTADAPISGAMMMTKAAEMAGEDEILATLIEDAEIAAVRGKVGGSVERLSRLPAGQSDVWEVPFYGDSHAEIAVLGDGDTNLDVLVTDENGNTVCYDVGWSDKVLCDFVPAWNGYFYVTVQNGGDVGNSYSLMTN